MKCGASRAKGVASTSGGSQSTQQSRGPVIAPAGATALKCPSCGAPISPKFGEMVITCEYCGTGVTLNSDGWKNVQKHTMLPMRLTKDQVEAKVAETMDKGVFRHHMHEESVLEEQTASFIPYWVIPVSARTSIVSVDAMAEAGQVATTAALMGIMLGGLGGGRRSLGGQSRLGAPLFLGLGSWRRALGVGGKFALPSTMFYGGMGMGMGGGTTKTSQLDMNYNFPVVAMKDLTDYQPRDYSFNLSQRQLFDVSKIDKSIKVLNGDISEDLAQAQAKTLVDQLQSQKAHAQYHMIQQMHTDMDVAEGELLHVPVWFSRYDHKGKKIVFVLDGSSGAAINSMGL
jgi:uncharacterized Zn finger protein (UPF0148 family)